MDTPARRDSYLTRSSRVELGSELIPASFCTVGGLLREILPSAHITIGEGGPRRRLGRPQSGRGVSTRRQDRESTPPLSHLPNLARYAILSRNFENDLLRGHPLRRACSTSTWIRLWLSRASDASAANKEIERERQRPKKNFPFKSPRGRFQPRVGAPAQLTPPLATGG